MIQTDTAAGDPSRAALNIRTPGGPDGASFRLPDRLAALLGERLGLYPLTDSNSRITAAQKWFAQAAGIVVAVMGVLVLIGWTFDLAALKAVSSEFVSMKANAALGFVFAGSSLYLLAGERSEKRWRLAAGLLALLTALIGWFTASEYLFDRTLGIDELLFMDQPGAPPTNEPGRMAATTAFNLLLLGVALLVLDFRHTYPSSQLMAVVAGLIALFVATSYAYAVGSADASSGYTGMSLHASLAFLLLSAGILVCRQDRGILLVLTSNAAGGVLARRLLPASIVLPAVLGWLVLAGERAGIYETGFAFSVLVMATIVAFTLATWWNAGSQYHLDLERRRAEEDLRQGRAQLAEAQRIAQIGSFDWDLPNNTVTWSEELYRICGLSADDTSPSYEAFLERVHPDDGDLFKNAITNSLKTAEPFSLDYRIVRPDRSVRAVHGEGTVIMHDGQSVRVTGTAQDITERKRIEYALRRSEARNRSIIDNANDAFIAIDQGGTITDWNPQAEATFGWERDEAIGRTLADTIVPPRFREAHIEGLHRFLTTREGAMLNKRIEMPALHRDGHEFPLELTISVVGSGRSYLFSAFARDISERKRAEEALARQAQELARTNAELEDFTHSVSHDLKEPLRGIEAFAGFLAEDYGPNLDEQGQGYINVLRDSAVRMKDLIDDLLQLSRIGRTAVEHAAVPTRALVEDVALELSFQINEKGVELRIDPDLPIVACDTVRIREVFKNLISNAIKYNDKPRPVVEVTASREDGLYTFSVKDNGIGIAPQYHEKIFRIFQRLHRREDYEGTGVGLTICKKVVEAHGGNIWVESEPGEGTAFLFTIPKLTDTTQPSQET